MEEGGEAKDTNDACQIIGPPSFFPFMCQCVEGAFREACTCDQAYLPLLRTKRRVVDDAAMIEEEEAAAATEEMMTLVVRSTQDMKKMCGRQVSFIWTWWCVCMCRVGVSCGKEVLADFIGEVLSEIEALIQGGGSEGGSPKSLVWAHSSNNGGRLLSSSTTTPPPHHQPT